jgi:hypothetical protein
MSSNYVTFSLKDGKYPVNLQIFRLMRAMASLHEISAGDENEVEIMMTTEIFDYIVHYLQHYIDTVMDDFSEKDVLNVEWEKRYLDSIMEKLSDVLEGRHIYLFIL